MPNLTADIPHQLSREEAKGRIMRQLDTMRTQQGGLGGLGIQLRETWHGDRMDFAAMVMGQSCTGHLMVHNQVVHVDVMVPWFLSLLAGPVLKRMEQEGQKLLSGPGKTA